MQVFFQTHPGGYGEGDRFLGVTVPVQRKLARQFAFELDFKEIAESLQSPWHEVRLTTLFIMILRYQRAKQTNDVARAQALVDMYLENLDFVNNWDLVDSSAHLILGVHLQNKPCRILWDLARSGHLWRQRVAMIATFHFIRRDDFDTTMELAREFLNHPHDLMAKAVGWMLREVGNRDVWVLHNFLQSHATLMPRTMLRYAIEKFSPAERQRYLRMGKL